jgi:hypothetical protein
MAELCCRGNLDEACSYLSTAFEAHAVPLGELVMDTGALCLDRISDSVAKACKSGCSPDEKRWLLWAANSMTPTSKLIDMSLTFLESSFDPREPGYFADKAERDGFLRTPQEQVRDEAVRTIARLGDEELEQLGVMLADRNPRLRIEMLSAFDEARLLAPVHAPKLHFDLEIAREDTDERVAKLAGKVAEAYFTEPRTPASAAIEHLPIDVSDAIRMLAVRRFSCFARSAEAVLQGYATREPRYKADVDAAIALRRRRCAKYPEAPTPE